MASWTVRNLTKNGLFYFVFHDVTSLLILLSNVKLSVSNVFILPKNICEKINYFKISNSNYFFVGDRTNTIFGLLLDIMDTNQTSKVSFFIKCIKNETSLVWLK